MRQGDIYWYRFSAPNKRRPVLILTRSSALLFLTNATVAPLTTTIRGIPTEVVLTCEDGVRETCAVNLDNIQTISKSNLGAFIPASIRFPYAGRSLSHRFCFGI